MTLNAMDFATRFFKGQDELKGPLRPELCAPAYVAEVVGFPAMDAAGHSEFGRAFYAAFPDLSHTIDEARSTDNGIVVRFTLRGTHTAPFMNIPATNRAITVSAMVLMTMANGQVTHLHGIFDQLGMMRQLGVLPS
jgi:SnoaL-like polyketide cyclase